MVHGQFPYEPLVHHTVDVQVVIRRCEIAVVDIVLYALYLALHLIEDSVIQYIVLEHEGNGIVRGDELIILVIVVVELQQVSAVLQGGFHQAIGFHILIGIVNVQTLGAYLYLLTEVVVAHVMTIDDELHVLPMHIPGDALSYAGIVLPCLLYEMSQVKGHTVAYHRVVEPVGQEHPTLVFGHTQYRLLILELHS